MKPEQRSHTVLSITRSKAKMYEYDVPLNEHINIPSDPSKLFDLTIGMLGEFAANELNNLEDGTVEAKKRNLKFSSYFFDAYFNSRLNEGMSDYLFLFGSAAYFLCDLLGSSSVFIKKIDQQSIDLDVNGLDKFLVWVLKGKFESDLFIEQSIYSQVVTDLKSNLAEFQLNGFEGDIVQLSADFRNISYQFGTPRELLITDVALAIIKKRINISVWKCLPAYSGIELEIWRDMMSNIDIRELWPSQRLLGEMGVYAGKSAVVQMPTSAGKTKSTELIIRSAFLSGRASLAVIVAPFRALCTEIHDDLQKVFLNENINVDRVSDSIQTDFELNEFLGCKQILVITPEKLNYLLRYDPTFSEQINLLIYDEGHLFDDLSRGVTYELLLSSLKGKISVDTQVILISAVISNAENIKNWLLNEQSEVASGVDLLPTYRTVAFTSWTDKQLHFVSPESPSNQAFFVPKVLNQHELELQGRERKQQLFPKNGDGNDIALYLGLRLCSQGTVAIFTGRKDTAANLVERMLYVFKRNINLPYPNSLSDAQEINRLNNLYTKNFGENHVITQAASLGVFSHHGNTPQGIRLSIEYALQNALIKFVICTSTLAQGVNLPLRYLIVTNTRHNRDAIKTRDFHNLIGRAGRSGMHTEGSIIFANPEIWDQKNWRWSEAIDILDSSNSEPCTSAIVNLFLPIKNLRQESVIQIDPITLVEYYIDNYSQINEVVDGLVERYSSKTFPEPVIREKFHSLFSIISNIESYILSNSEEGENYEETIINLAKNTLAYAQLEGENKQKLVDIFKLVSRKILILEGNAEKRIIYSRIFRGVHECLYISSWVKSNTQALINSEAIDDYLNALWPLFSKYIDNSVFNKIDSESALKSACLAWVRGQPFYEIYEMIKEHKVGNKKTKIEHAVNLCEGGFSYDGALIIGAISQLLEIDDFPDIEGLDYILQIIQKYMKYGLPSQEAIQIYELGFSDRVLAQELAQELSGVNISKSSYIEAMISKRGRVEEILNDYPSYFQTKYKTNILGE